MTAPWGSPLNVPITGWVPWLLTITKVFPAAGVRVPLSIKLAPVRLTSPTTLSWLYWVLTVGPLMAKARLASEANAKAPEPTLASVPLVRGLTAPVALGRDYPRSGYRQCQP